MAQGAKERLSRLAPAGDLQLLWATAFIRSARQPDDVAWVQGLLDGNTKLDGLNVDFAIRWSVVNALATIGAAGEELIAAELERDPTDQGRRAAASARAARPLAEAKAEAWVAVTGDELSLAMKRAIAGGFHRADQEELLSAYVQPYFDKLLPIWEGKVIEEALGFIKSMYPDMVVTQEVVDLTDAWLARDLPGPARRSLLESQDDLKRALQARAFNILLPLRGEARIRSRLFHARGGGPLRRCAPPPHKWGGDLSSRPAGRRALDQGSSTRGGGVSSPLRGEARIRSRPIHAREGAHGVWGWQPPLTPRSPPRSAGRRALDQGSSTRGRGCLELPITYFLNPYRRNR